MPDIVEINKKKKKKVEITYPKRAFCVIAKEIEHDWTNMYFGARPYVRAMRTLIDFRDDYWNDTAETIIIYFLSNATTWRGEVARYIKGELKYMLKHKDQYSGPVTEGENNA